MDFKHSMPVFNQQPPQLHAVCAQCGIRTCQHPHPLCPVCYGLARKAIFRRRWEIFARWFAASMLEGVLGLIVGVFAFVPLFLPNGVISLHGAGVAFILVGIFAANVAVAHAWILQPVIDSCRYWGLSDGLELVVHWLVFAALTAPFGFFHGSLALASCVSGLGAAFVQSYLLRSQLPSSLPWVIGSLLAWIIGGGFATLAELFTTTIRDSIVVGVVVARVAYSMFAGPMLSFLLTQKMRSDG